jgi:hypothetical protein
MPVIDDLENIAKDICEPELLLPNIKNCFELDSAAGSPRISLLESAQGGRAVVL